MNKVINNLLIIFLILLFTSCASHKPSEIAQQPLTPQAQAETKIIHADDKVAKQPAVIKKAEPKSLRTIIVDHAIQSVGQPYKWGGKSPKSGFDCSGLVVYTHKKAKVITPRTSRAQFKKGKVIPRKDITLADLVFFKTTTEEKIFHVGIYIGDGIFVHAPGKGRKVTYGSLSNPYFKKNFIGSRSFL
jgi:cell wall-associated NlpC family hydrolase